MKAVLFAFALIAACGSTPSHNDVVQSALDSTVVVIASYVGGDGRQYRDWPVCSGFVIQSSGTRMAVVTARHCLGGLEIREVKFRDGDAGAITRVRTSKKSDVAILDVVTFWPHRPLIPASSVDTGESLFVLGCPSGGCNSYAAAESRNGNTLADGGFEGMVLLINCGACWHGDSGGPVMRMDGSVIGVLDAGGDDNAPTVVLVAPIQSALDLLHT